jgi:Fungal Zn(2)-Cys(6) binuclear cluster domain
MDLLTTPPAASASSSGISSESSGGESSVNSPGKTRSACNRCHAQKLKCVRKAGQGSSCERCVRLKTSCRFSPRAARSSSRLPGQAAVEIALEDPLPVPASIPMPIRHSHTTTAGVSEVESLCPSGESTGTDGGHGQFATHISKQVYLRLTCLLQSRRQFLAIPCQITLIRER